MPKAKLSEVEVIYDDTGSGEPVVFVHGHPFNRSMWAPQTQAVADMPRRVVAADLRGYGDSDVVPGVTLLSTFADDVVELLDHLGIDKATIVGLSMGGQIVMDLYSRFPERVSALVLSDTFPDAETETGVRSRMELADTLVKEGMSAYAASEISQMVGPKTLAARGQVADHVKTMMLETPPAGAAAALRGRALRHDYVKTLSTIDVPVLIVVGRDDEFTPVADAQRMHDIVPDSRLAVIEDAGHVPNLEQPEVFNEILLRFLIETGTKP